MIDKETGVVHFDRYEKNKKHGDCIRLWDDGTKQITSLEFDRQTFERKFDCYGKEINQKQLRVLSKPSY